MVFDTNSSTITIAKQNTAIHSFSISQKLIKTYILHLGNDTIIDYYDISKLNPSITYILSYKDLLMDVD